MQLQQPTSPAAARTGACVSISPSCFRN